MSRSSTRRAQVEPTVALAAVFAVCAGLTLYATVLGGSLPTPERDRAEPALSRVHGAVERAGVTHPSALGDAPNATTDRFRVNVSLVAEGRRWTAGPTPPAGGTDAARRRVSVRTNPGRVRPGWLRVEAWR